MSPTGRDAGGPAGELIPAPVTIALPVHLQLRFRPPMALGHTLRFLGRRAVPGLEHYDGTALRRTLPLLHGPGLVAITGASSGQISVRLRLTDERDRDQAAALIRRLLDLDADPAAVDPVLIAIPALADRFTAGLRAPGAVDGFEMAVRAVVGQQISVAGARTLLGRIVAEHGRSAFADAPGWQMFPEPAVIAGLDPVQLPMPAARGRTLVTLAAAMASGDLQLHSAVDRTITRKRLLSLSGIGPWTADYLLMRATGDPDVFLGSDLGVRHALAALRRTGREVADPTAAAPWRSYLTHHLWNVMSDPTADMTAFPGTPLDSGN